MSLSRAQLGPSAIQQALADYRAGDYESALVSLAEAQVREEDYLDLAYVLGLCHVRLGRWDEALLYLEQVVTADADGPRVRQCRQTLAYVYAVTGRTKLAEYELKKLVEAGLETPQIYATLGYAAWNQGRLDEGLRWYGKALELDPDNANALNGYGYLLACSGRDLPRALTSCRKALDGDPSNPAYQDSLGWAYFRLGMLPEAARHLSQAAELLADQPEVANHIKALNEARKA